jgi:hypothetical protein
VQKPVDLGDEILWDRGLPTQLDPHLNLQVVSHRRCADLTDLVGKILNLVRLEVSGGDVNARRRWLLRSSIGQGLFDRGTFSLWPLSLVDRADSLLLNVGEQLGSNLNAIRGLRPSYCRYVHF